MLSKLKTVLTSKIVKAVGVTLLVALLIASAISYFSQKSTIKQSALDSFINQVMVLEKQQKYKVADSQIQTYLHDNDKKLTNDGKSQVLFALGANYVLLKDFPKAVDAFKKSAQLQGTLNFSTAHAIADAAISAGQKDVAIEYYQKAIDIAKTDADPYDNQSIEGYQNTIRYLQGGSLQPGASGSPIPAGINVPKEFL